MKKKLVRLFVTIGLAVQIASCASTYDLPKVTKDLDYTWVNNTVIDSLPISKGLTSLFDDDHIDSLIHEVIRNNHDLKAAKNRLMASNYMLSQTSSLLLPSVGLGVSKSRGNQNINLISGKNEVKDNHSISVNVAWEVDVWGKLFELNSASTLEWEAQKEEYFQAIDALVARTIQVWINVAAIKKELKLKKEKQNRFLNLLKSDESRYKNGIINIGELNDIRSNVEITNAELSEIKSKMNESLRELELLLGRNPKANLISIDRLPSISKPILNIPSVVLQNRPDIKASILRLNSSLKNASAAKKAMLPSLNLSAEMFKESVKAGDVTGSTLIWNILGSLVQPIFNGGRLWNEAKARDLESEAAISDLYSTMLKVLKEVEDALENEKVLGEQKKFLEKSLNYLSVSRKDFRERYKNGLAQYFELVNAENQYADIEIQINQLKAVHLSNRISLALASGYSFGEEFNNGDNI